VRWPAFAFPLLILLTACAKEPRRYVYAPSVLTDYQNNYTWTCSNLKDGVIQDSIFFTKTPAGEMLTGLPTTLAIAPSEAGQWGSFHVCDPSVVQGSFVYFGDAFRYAMFVTGTPLNASADNSVGVAFSNEPAGPWTVAPAPVIANPFSLNAWGEGQPSVVCVDGSRVLLAWSDGGPTLSRTKAAWVTLASQSGESGPGGVSALLGSSATTVCA